MQTIISVIKIKILRDYLFILAGTIFYSVAVSLILEPSHLTAGGVTGVSLIIHSITGIKTGLIFLLLNIPLVISGFKIFGKGFVLKTAVSVVLVSFFMGVLEPLGRKAESTVAAAIIGGSLLGVGIALVFSAGSTTGGIDIAVKIMNKRWKRLSVGFCFLVFDIAVIVGNTVVYNNTDALLSSLISVYLSSRIINICLRGEI